MSTPDTDLTGQLFPLTLAQICARASVSYADILVGLSRAGAMSEYPPLQFMMQSMPQAGYFRPLMAVQTAAEVERLAQEFARLTGYGEHAARYLFDSFGYALGVLETPPALPAAVTSPTPNAEAASEASGTVGEPELPYNASSPAWNNYWTLDRKLRHINSLIETDRDNEQTLGVTAMVPACIGVAGDSIKLSAELRRTRPDAAASLWYAVYNQAGYVVATDRLGAIATSSPSRLPRQTAVGIPPSQIARILLYWDS